MDAFEKYIKAQREELRHIERPNREQLWERIAGKLDQDKQTQQAWTFQLGRYSRLAAAASVLLLIGIGWLLSSRLTPGPASDYKAFLRAYYPEVAATQHHLQQQVSLKKKALAIEQLDRAVHRHIFEELQQVEAHRQEFAQDLLTQPESEGLVQLLIRCYELEIRILERLAQELEKQQRYENQSSGKPL